MAWERYYRRKRAFAERMRARKMRPWKIALKIFCTMLAAFMLYVMLLPLRP